MATTKKAAVKKPATRTTKTTRVTSKPKRVVAKRSTAKKSAASRELRSFRIAKDDTPFTTFRVTRQTFYWVVLVAFIIFAQLWIISLQVEVASLLDAQQAQLMEMQ